VQANGNTVELVGTIDGGKAVVTLTQPCYNTAGRILISIFNTVGSTKLCIYAAIAYVQTAEHGDLIDGSQIIDSVEDLITDIQDAVASIPPDYSTLSNQVADLKSAIDDTTEVLNYFHIADQTKSGITLTNTENGVLLNGTASSSVNFMVSSLSRGAEAGEYTGSFQKVSGTSSSSSGVSVRSWKSSSSSARWLNEANTNLPIPACAGISLTVSSGVTVTNYLVKIQISKGSEAGEYYSESLSAVDIKARDEITGVSTTVGGIEETVTELSGIVPNISGAANLFEHYTETKSGITITKNADGTYTINGIASEAVAFTNFVISPGTYTAEISVVSGETTGNGLSIRYGTGGTLWTAGTKTEKTLEDDTIVYLRASPGTFTDYIINVKILSTAHPVTAVDYVARYNAEMILPTGTFVPTNILGTFAMGTCVNKREITVDNNTTVIAYGDSITRGTEGRNPWVYYLSEITGCTVINKAVGNALFGESVRPSDKWISTQIANTTSVEWESAGLIVLAAGTNDIGGNTPAAELKEKVQAAITTIKANTNAPILFITPIWRGEGSTDPDLIRIPYVSGIIRSVALENRCSVINGLDFPIPSWSNGVIEKLTADGLHPNNTGAYIYAMCVVNAID
jgi:lysophospholipase L1-like esterase